MARYSESVNLQVSIKCSTLIGYSVITMLINFYLALKQISGLNINCATNNDKQSPATLWGRTMYNMLYTVSSRWTPLNLKAESFSQIFHVFFQSCGLNHWGNSWAVPRDHLQGGWWASGSQLTIRSWRRVLCSCVPSNLGTLCWSWAMAPVWVYSLQPNCSRAPQATL